MPDERLRAAAKKFLHDNYPHCWGYPKCDGDLPGEPHEDGCPAKNTKPPKPADVMAAFAKEREDSAMREAAGLVCSYCRSQNGPNEIKPVLQGGKWLHLASNRIFTVTCAAGPIHERLALKGGTE